MTLKPVPPRLHILLARNGKTGLVIRRGPSKQVCTIAWDRTNDTFTLGQWLKGSIYERRCDLSPNGKYFLYFATKKGEFYTAISQAPYLKALSFWPKGDTWGGGGYFWDDSHVHIKGWHPDTDPQKALGSLASRIELIRDDPYENEYGWHGWGDPGGYYPLLMRCGWTFIERKKLEPSGHKAIFEKPLTKGWILRKIAFEGFSDNEKTGDSRGNYYDRHQLVNTNKDEVIDYPDWEWADYDGRRLMWVTSGRLYTGLIKKSGLTATTECYDFNNMKFENLLAPY